MKQLLAAWMLLVAAMASQAGDTTPDDAMVWLQRITNAAQQLNYSGSFVYQHGQQVETSRITHMKDASGEYEKLVTLDGRPRQIYRNNDEVYCFMPDDKTVMVDRHRVKKSFPALLPPQIAGLSEFYEIKLGGQERVAGRECQVIILTPKDQYRYGHRLWADTQTGLLLKASTWSEKKQIVDQFAFTQIKIGGPIDRSEVKPALKGKRLVRSTGEGTSQPLPIDSGWDVSGAPPGFKKVNEMKRVLPGASMPVNHIVFSDGLAAASVFIEPVSEKSTLGLSHQGALNVYSRQVGEYQVKVLGEVPAATVMHIGDAVSFRK
ncbi:MAG: MucB/RseB C-terminal domain-containing protein [Burkholderiales bacterium]|nr:MucB/RseB C-terminal domain-containing protein [Burkholderiales bacterium]